MFIKIQLAIIIFFSLNISKSSQECTLQLEDSILKRNYLNTMVANEALISSALQNGFVQGNSGSCLRQEIYDVNYFKGYTQCPKNQQIKILLMQKYLLNSLRVWIWDRGYVQGEVDRFYNIIIYAKLGQSEKKIYENAQTPNLITVQFPDQFVQEFILLNVNGNNYNTYLHIIKIEAYYKWQ